MIDKNGSAYRALQRIWRKVRLLRMARALTRDHLYDLRRYLRWSHGMDTDRTEAQSRHALYKAYHGVEKGLSLSEPRPGFGRDKVMALTRKLQEYRDRHGVELAPAVSALHAYQAFNATHDVDNAPLEAFLAGQPDNGVGGTARVTAQDIRAAGAQADASFFWSRHSVRQYAPTPVDLDLIAEAVDRARKTPSVCNRQGPRVHVFENAQQALDWQPGNRGFGDRASRALVVTADLQAFSGAGERNQPFVDGGMFAMSLLYALHSLGLGACPLAWSMRHSDDQKMRQALNIPDSEAVIMMISVGHLPEELEVARSHRMGLDHVMVLHGAPGQGDVT
ncbi:nitroreductase family protein [Primorskyibacter sp. S187A]|uniref:nitroreductase family protein n=1 Tax=Primorskyibacter sp. S187A TaxID=3415130 RepID=UPI003C7D00B4